MCPYACDRGEVRPFLLIHSVFMWPRARRFISKQAQFVPCLMILIKRMLNPDKFRTFNALGLYGVRSEGGLPSMYKRSVDIICSMRTPRCTVVLLILVSTLFASPLIVYAVARDVSEKSKSSMTTVEKRCDIPLEYKMKWEEPEKWAWIEICEGRIANFNIRPGNERLDPKNPEHEHKWLGQYKWSYDNEWSDGRRTLRSRFLRTILLHEPFHNVIPRQGIWITGAYFKDEIDLSGASIEQPLILSHSRFKSGIDLSSLKTTKVVSFIVLKLDGDLDMDSALFKDDLNIISVAFGDLLLMKAKINGDLAVSYSESKYKLNLSSTFIGGDLYMAKVKFVNVVLKRAKIGGFLNMSDSEFTGELDMRFTSIEDNLLMQNVQFEQPAKLVSLTVKSNLDMRGATLSRMDLTDAQIERNLRLGFRCAQDSSSCKDQDKKIPKWKKYTDFRGKSHAPKLILRNTSVGALLDTEDAWPDNLELEFDNFTYKRFDSNEKKTPYERGSVWFVEWLAKDASYSQQPYLQLVRVLRSNGLNGMADDILYANRERERDNSTWPELGLLTILWAIFGYGYGWRSLLTLVWASVFVCIGTALILESQSNKHDDEGNKKLGFWYSLDMLLPVIQLREEHYEVDLHSKVKYYFYVHKIIGYVLIFFLLAGFSGFTKYLTD